MKFLCDVHISYRLCNFLTSQGMTCVHVNSILDKWQTPDTDIARYADKNGLVVITKDADFRNSYLLKKGPAKLIRIALGNISNDELIKIFADNLSEFRRLFEHDCCFVEIHKGNIQVIR